jgi:perosamine synthetase
MSGGDVPLSRPSIGEAEIAAVCEVMRSGWLAHGKYNHLFETAFADVIGVPHAVSMSNCTSAIEAALRVADIRGEVVVPSFTWVASANAVVTSGATPIFCEVDRATRNVTADTVAAVLSPRTEAVMAVHFGGQPCAMDRILSLCERHGIFLIEDSAETLAATWRGRPAGSFGVGCFSFFPTKNITTGEGGMLTCRDGEFARKVRTLASHGITSTTMEREKSARPWLRVAEMAGHNFRLSNVLAAIGYHQLLRLGEMNGRRIALAARYDQAFASEPRIRRPAIADGATHVYQMYTVEVPEEIRDAVVTSLRRQGISASVHFDPPVHLHPFYRELGWHEGQLPITECLVRSLITLPIFPDMTLNEQDRVIETLTTAVAQEISSYFGAQAVPP